ncbi:hypothetical protein AMAG_05914 [Allomyces macrogynus ATCC 38327]|uniref:Uncharacterized protein n=1 Tax=Allomyces macrogynus (strain ATCC 38327) TaxID=578462 RepID=A0A0L0SDB7_ALLM3|nr:hypothetical protein AMAG_05914 [Allomyces macrogynus ATCC 38327]|eukprot:KNE60533.1 hypothetical protein AMAG_05914 [Allomyces macrogynus ATCC 38327]
MLATVTHLMASHDVVALLISNNALPNLVHVELLETEGTVLVESLPATLRSIPASLMHPHLVESLSRLPNLLGVEGMRVGCTGISGVINPVPLLPPIDVLRLDYHAGSALVVDPRVAVYELLEVVRWAVGRGVDFQTLTIDEGDIERDAQEFVDKPFSVDIRIMPGVDETI